MACYKHYLSNSIVTRLLEIFKEVCMRIKKTDNGFILIIKQLGVEEKYNSYDEAWKIGVSYFGGVA